MILSNTLQGMFVFLRQLLWLSLMLINLKLVCWQGFLDVNPFGCNSVLLWTWVFSRLQLCWIAWSWLAHWRLTSMKNIWPFPASMAVFIPLFNVVIFDPFRLLYWLFDEFRSMFLNLFSPQHLQSSWSAHWDLGLHPCWRRGGIRSKALHIFYLWSSF